MRACQVPGEIIRGGRALNQCNLIPFMSLSAFSSCMTQKAFILLLQMFLTFQISLKKRVRTWRKWNLLPTHLAPSSISSHLGRNIINFWFLARHIASQEINSVGACYEGAEQGERRIARDLMIASVSDIHVVFQFHCYTLASIVFIK